MGRYDEAAVMMSVRKWEWILFFYVVLVVFFSATANFKSIPCIYTNSSYFVDLLFLCRVWFGNIRIGFSLTPHDQVINAASYSSRSWIVALLYFKIMISSHIDELVISFQLFRILI